MRSAKAQERRKTLRDLLHDRLEEHAEEIVQCFLTSAREGDWRAADALITRGYGKPQEKLEVSRQPDDFDLTKLSLEELGEMRNRILTEHPELANFVRACKLVRSWRRGRRDYRPPLPSFSAKLRSRGNYATRVREHARRCLAQRGAE